MSEQDGVPEEFASLTELANEGLGGFAMFATDDFFAGKENLLKRAPPVFLPDEYTGKGKWMDGWESQRRRTPGHDFCLVRLGVPGVLAGVVVDTTHFKGNAPSECALEGLEAPSATVAQLLASDAWFDLVARSQTRPDSQNAFAISDRRRVTHLRLRIYPDGGVARLRAYGRASPDERVFRRPGALDLVAVEHGGVVVGASDRFFGPPSNLLLPGRGVNMGDGWETARRRTPGSDWTVLQLGRAGVVERVEVDTHFFKGNAPQAVLLEAIDARSMPANELDALCVGGSGWKPLVAKTPAEPHRRHQLFPERAMVATHVRVHIFPHGGVNRLRLYGEPLDSERDAEKLARLNAMPNEEARAIFLSFNGSPALANDLGSARPFASVRALFRTLEAAWWRLPQSEQLAAFAAHPRLGEKKAAARQNPQSATWSAGEQSSAATTDDALRAELAEKNERYFEKFGFIYIACATGRTAAELLESLNERLERTRAEELETAAAEQSKITLLRLEKWLSA